MGRLVSTFALIAALGSPAAADDITETIQAALDAYQNGNIQVALEELAFARQMITEMKTQSLSAFLPEAPAGWTREIDTDMAAGMAMMGGGVGTEATYAGDGHRLTITMMADNPMVQGFAGMLSSVGLLGGMKPVRIRGERFLNQDGEIVGLVANRVLVQAAGAEQAVIVPILQTIDFDGLGKFGQ